MRQHGEADLLGLAGAKALDCRSLVHIAMPADAIFALVPLVTTASLCFFSTFGAAFPSMIYFTFAFT